MKCEIYMNDVVMEERWEDNPNVQIERNKNPNNEEEIMKNHLKKLHAQRIFWKLHRTTSLCWVFYYVNDNQEVNVKHANIMCHILCYNGMVNICNPRTQARNELISYYKTNGVTSLKNIWTKIMLLL